MASQDIIALMQSPPFRPRPAGVAELRELAGTHHQGTRRPDRRRQAVSPRITALLDAEWRRQLAPPGLRSYDELRARLSPRA